MKTEPTKRNRMLEKVRALLNKADRSRGATAAESESFLAKARELMTRHGIEEMDAMAPGDESCFDIGRSNFDSGRGRRVADTYVFHILTKCFGVDVVFTSYYKPGQRGASLQYAIMGDAPDREMAKHAAPIIYKSMRSGLTAWLKSAGQKWSAATERSFCSGLCNGYISASEEGKRLVIEQLSKTQQEQFGLILVQKDALTKAFVQKEFKSLKKIRGGKMGTADAHNAGFGAGASMKLTKTHALS